MTRFNKWLALPVVGALCAFGMTASAQTAGPRLGVELLSNGLTQNPTAGMTNITYAAVRLDTTYSSEDIRLSSLPIQVTASNGALASNLNNCRVFNATTNSSTSLNNGTNIPTGLANGMNTVAFDSPLYIPRGTVTTLNVECDLAGSAVAGGAYQFSINTANVLAYGNTTGLPATVVVGDGSIVPVTVPVVGVPNTGLGGEAGTNIALMLASIAAIGLGTLYVRRTAR